jgi:hypothetical protein
MPLEEETNGSKLTKYFCTFCLRTYVPATGMTPKISKSGVCT